MKKLTGFIMLSLLAAWQLAASSQFADSIFHMKQDVVDFSDTGIAENVRGSDFVAPSPADLVVGSIFEDVDGSFKKVTAIREGGDGTVYIDTIKPDIREVLEFMYIPDQDLVVNIGNLAAVLAEGSQDYADGTSSRLGGSFTTTGWSMKLKEGDHTELSLTVDDVYGDIYIKANFGAALPYIRVKWRKKKWWLWVPVVESVKGYVNASYQHNLGIGFTIGLSVETSDDLSTVEIPIYTLGGNKGIKAGLYFVDGVEGEFSFSDTLKYRNKVSASAGCTLDGLGIICWPTGCWGSGNSKHFFSNELELGGDATAKMGIFLKAEIEWGDFSLFELSVGGGPFSEFEGAFTYGVSYNTEDEDTKEIYETGWHYDPYPQGKARLSTGLFAEGDISVLDKWGKQFLDEAWRRTIFQVGDFND